MISQLYFFVTAIYLRDLISLLNLIEGKPVNEKETQQTQLIAQERREGHFIISKMETEERKADNRFDITCWLHCECRANHAESVHR